jgi:hypothetical protein
LSPDADVARKLARLIAQKGPDGRPLYALEDIKDAFAVLMLSQKLPPDQVSAEAKMLLAQFAGKIGFAGSNTDADGLIKLMDAYLKEHPIDPELMKALHEALAS